MRKVKADNAGRTDFRLFDQVPNSDDYRIGFEATVSNGVNTEKAMLLKLGGGMTINQTNGKLLIASGTTVKSETAIRLVEDNKAKAFNVPFNYRSALMLSARNANQSFIFEMVDIIGDGLAYSATSATSISVTKPEHGFDPVKDIGKKMNIGIFNTDAQPSQEVVIASISGDIITYTGAGFAVGTGTCSLFGLNSIYMIYDGGTATSYKVGARRNGRDFVAGGSAVTGTTTAAMLTDLILCSKNSICWKDKVTALVTTNGLNTRACIESAIPDPEIDLFAQIRVVNGTTAPTAATLTVDFVSISDLLEPFNVNISGTENSGGLPLEAKMAQSNETIGAIAALPAGTNTIGAVMAAVNAAAGGINLNSRIVSAAATTNATSAKASAGRVYKVRGTCKAAASRFLKFYNKASAPIVGTDVPIMTFELNAGATYDIDFGWLGFYFSTGIAYAITTGSADNDTGACTAGDIVGHNVFHV